MVFDAKGTNFRHEMFPEYKANRTPAHDDLIVQIEPLYKIVRAMGFHFLCVDGVEADDVIATLSKFANDKGIKTIIASGDKDLFQLVGENIQQLDMKLQKRELGRTLSRILRTSRPETRSIRGAMRSSRL